MTYYYILMIIYYVTNEMAQSCIGDFAVQAVNVVIYHEQLKES